MPTAHEGSRTAACVENVMPGGQKGRVRVATPQQAGCGTVTPKKVKYGQKSDRSSELTGAQHGGRNADPGAQGQSEKTKITGRPGEDAQTAKVRGDPAGLVYFVHEVVPEPKPLMV